MAESPSEQEMRAYAAAKARDAFQAIFSIMNDGAASEANRLKAAGMVLERAYGKPDSAPRTETPKAALAAELRAEMEALGDE